MNNKLIIFTFGVFVAGALVGRALPESAGPGSRIKIYGHSEVGFTANLGSPKDKQNFGRLFDDRSNEPMLNQLVYTAEQTLDPKATGFDLGFKLQGMYGSDSRLIHSTGLLDRSGKQILQPDLVEAYLNLHYPVQGTAGGVDVKLGKFVTLEGVDLIDSVGNVFYSRNYIFNFGIPLTHTGAMVTIHASKGMDVMLGVVGGVNTFKDNNGRLAFHGGVSWPNLAGGKLSILATTHIGPETPRNNRDFRYLNDLVAIYRVSDNLTATTDLNYIQDDGAKAKGYGIAQIFAFVLDQTLTANFRGELWRDNNGFFVAQFANHTDYLSFQRGDTFTPDSRTVGGGATTYGALTAGLSWKATDAIVVRPELRYDSSLSNTRPFNDSRRKNMFTVAMDVTWSF